MSEESKVTEAGPGALLKEVREQQGLSVKEVADSLKLMEQSIRNIEADDYKDTPITFYKGYIKNYAQLLGIEPSKASESFRQYVKKQGLETVTSISPQYDQVQFSDRSNAKNAQIFVKVISFLIVLGIVYSIYYFLAEKGYWNKFINSFDKQDVQQEQPLNTDENEGELIPDSDQSLSLDNGSELSLSNESVAQSLDANTSTNTSDLESNELTIEPENTEILTQEISAPVVTTPVTVATAKTELILAFSGDCWVQVIDATGRVLISGTKSNGHVSSVSGQIPYQLTIGNVSSVSIDFNGNPVDLSSYSSGKMAKLTLGS